MLWSRRWIQTLKEFDRAKDPDNYDWGQILVMNFSCSLSSRLKVVLARAAPPPTLNSKIPYFKKKSQNGEVQRRGCGGYRRGCSKELALFRCILASLFSIWGCVRPAVLSSVCPSISPSITIKEKPPKTAKNDELSSENLCKKMVNTEQMRSGGKSWFSTISCCPYSCRKAT